MPLRLERGGCTTAVRKIAGELIRAGMVNPSAHYEDVSTGLREEMRHWIAAVWNDIGDWQAAPQQWAPFWGFELTFTNDLDEIGLNQLEWFENLPDDVRYYLGGEPGTTGAFALAPSWDLGAQFCCVGSRVEKLQEAYGDAAFDALATVSGAVEAIVGMLSPTTVGQYIMYMGDYADYDEGRKNGEDGIDADILTADRVEACFPPGLPEWTLDKKRIDRAICKAQNPLPWQMEVMHLVRQLVNGRDAKLAVHSNWIKAFDDVFPVTAICAQWQRADELPRVLDEFNEVQSQSSPVPFVYINCWDERLPHNSPYGIRAAVERIGAVMRTLGRCHRILSLLDDTSARLMVTLGGSY